MGRPLLGRSDSGADELDISPGEEEILARKASTLGHDMADGTTDFDSLSLYEKKSVLVDRELE